ncbi:MAG: ABC transporter permease [Spirochaetales bacterium]|nr:MAG: ABC transporter permease [Spirochaetales bacterium]
MKAETPAAIRAAIIITVFMVLLGIWFAVSAAGAVPPYILPPPGTAARAAVLNAPAMLPHLLMTLKTVGIGYIIALACAAATALLMHRFRLLREILYPLLVVSQTVPLIVLAPLLILWFGFGILPKVLMVVLVCFFPIAVNLLAGMDAVDPDILLLFRSLNAGYMKTFFHARLPGSLPQLFAGLKIAGTYSIIGAVIGEWLGGTEGLGVYMVRAQKAFALEKVFAAIIYIVALSLVILGILSLLQKFFLPWAKKETYKPTGRSL